MDRFLVTPTVTGFEFTRDAAAQTMVKLKTPAGDIRGPWWPGREMDSVEDVVVVAVPPDAPPDLLRPGSLAAQGITVFAPVLRDPGHSLEALHDILAALAFLSGFGVDSIALAGAGVPGGAALAAAFGSPLVRGIALADPGGLPAHLPDRNHPPVALWRSPGAPAVSLLAGRPQVMEQAGPPAPGEMARWLLALFGSLSA